MSTLKELQLAILFLAPFIEVTNPRKVYEQVCILFLCFNRYLQQNVKGCLERLAYFPLCTRGQDTTPASRSSPGPSPGVPSDLAWREK